MSHPKKTMFIYQHETTGRLYRQIGTALNQSSCAPPNQLMVIYTPNDDEGTIFVKPYYQFSQVFHLVELNEH